MELLDNQQLTKKQRRALKKQQEQEQRAESQAQTQKKRRLFRAGAMVVLVIAIFGILKMIPTDTDGTVAGATAFSDPFKGGAEATVVIELYEDFQCPACGLFQPVIREVMARYGDQIKVVYNDFPLPRHQYGRTAAIAAQAANAQGKFWEYHDLLYENQAEWSEVSSSRVKEIFRSYAQDLGLDLTAFDAAQDDATIAASIDQDEQEARTRRINATPTVIVNGKPFDGVRSVESLSKEIDRLLR
jgi:protein-disulfide isomerase